MGTLNDLRQATFSRRVVSKCYVFSQGIYSFNKRNIDTEERRKGREKWDKDVIGPVTLNLEKVAYNPIGTFTFFSLFFFPFPFFPWTQASHFFFFLSSLIHTCSLFCNFFFYLILSRSWAPFFGSTISKYIQRVYVAVAYTYTPSKVCMYNACHMPFPIC